MDDPLSYDEFLARQARERRLDLVGAALLFIAVFAFYYAWQACRAK
jgi:hypothetical protein